MQFAAVEVQLFVEPVVVNQIAETTFDSRRGQFGYELDTGHNQLQRHDSSIVVQDEEDLTVGVVSQVFDVA